MINTILLISNIRAASNKKIPLESRLKGLMSCAYALLQGGEGTKTSKGYKRALQKKIQTILSIKVDRLHFVFLVQLKAASNCQRNFLDGQQSF